MMADISLLPPLLFLLILSLFAAAAPAALAVDGTRRCHPDDEEALLTFKDAVKEATNEMLSTWKPNTFCCGNWSGVSCGANSRVTALQVFGVDATQSSLPGSIPPAFSKLQMLQDLRLHQFKNLTGPFPAAVLELSNLEYLAITGAKLRGPLPSDIGRLLSKLAHLELTWNRFSGRLPPSLAELAHLTHLEQYENMFSGEIPPVLARLENLSELRLQHNRLRGRIIPDLPPHLTTLDLGNNLLTGTIPGDMGKLTNLGYLDLSSNRLRGPVPATFSNLANLSHLHLYGNSLEGPFPAMNANNFYSVDLSDNKFNLGTIPKWVESSTRIYDLGLRGCGLRMRMEDVKPLRTYEIVDLSHNEITGSPAEFLRNAGELVEFMASNNMLRFDMGKSSKFIQGRLIVLDVSHNQVYGRLPREILRFDDLDVSYNHLCGPIPQPNYFEASKFAHNDCLCGAPLRPCNRRHRS